MTKNNSRNMVFIIISTYLALQIFSDIGSLKILKLFSFSIDGGTFLYPFTFTLRDLIHRLTNKRTSQLIIFQSVILNLFMALFFFIIGILPSDLDVGEQSEFSYVLSPVWRLVIASSIAELLSELLDTEIYSMWVKKYKEKLLWGRVLFSNSLALILDSIVFCFIAFYGELPNSVLLSVIFSNILINEIITVISIPSIYLIKTNKLN